MTGPALGVMDRLFKGYQDAGAPRRMAVMVSYPDATTAPSVAQLATRLDQLTRAYPVLSAKVSKDTPVWEPLDAPPQGSSLVRSLSYTPDDTSTDTLHRLATETLHHAEADCDVNTGPLVHVYVYTSGAAAGGTYIGIGADHIVADGTGFLRLAHLLLQDASVDTGVESLAARPRPEDLLPILPNTPPTGPPPEAPPYWGTTKKGPTSLDLPQAYLYASLDAATASRINRQAKSKGIHTLGSIVYAAFIAAVLEVAEVGNEGLKLGIAVSDRAKSGPQAPAWSGNFFSTVNFVLESSPRPDVWGIAASVQTAVTDPARQAEGLAMVGRLAHLPMPMELFAPIVSASARPFLCSLVTTNLSRTTLPPRANDLTWVSTALPILTPVLVHFIGHEQGLRMSVAVRDGHALTHDQARRVTERWTALMHEIAGEA